MSWTARQREMLGLMGLRLWSPPETRNELAPEPDTAAASPTFAAAAEQQTATLRPAARAASAAAAAGFEARSGMGSEPPHDAAAPSSVPGQPQAGASMPAIGSGSAEGQAWRALQQDVATCSLCKLHAHRRQALFGTGPPDAQWLIVGDPPVTEEDRAGEPFAGPPGRLLDRMLAALHLTRETAAAAAPQQRVYLSHALRCMPAPGDHPGPEQWAACEPYLVRQTALMQPRVMIAMGRFAAQALLRSSEPLGRLRGRLHRWRDVPLVVTYHPAFLLRNPDFKAAAWADLVLAMRAFEQAGAVPMTGR